MDRVFKILIISIFVIGELFSFSLFSPQIHIYWSDWAILFLVFSVRKLSIGYAKFLIPFLVVCLLSLLLNFPTYGNHSLIIGGLYLLRYVAYTLIWLSLLRTLKLHQSYSLLRTIGILISAIGLLQYFFFPDLRSLAGGWDPHYYRLVGNLFDPGFFGLLLVFTLNLFTLHPYRSPVISWLAWSLAFLALALTYSRASYLAFMGSMFFTSVRRRSPVLPVLIICLSTLTYFLLPKPGGEGVNLKRSSTIVYRFTNLKNTLALIRSRPWLGSGFNLFRLAKRQSGLLDAVNWQTTHSGAGADVSFLFIAATTGIVGLAAFLFYLTELWRLIILRPFLVAWLIHSLFLNSLFFPHILLWLGLAIHVATCDTLPQSLSGSDSPKNWWPQIPARSLPPTARK